jgi:hypothetical protein
VRLELLKVVKIKEVVPEVVFLAYVLLEILVFALNRSLLC